MERFLVVWRPQSYRVRPFWYKVKSRKIRSRRQKCTPLSFAITSIRLVTNCSDELLSAIRADQKEDVFV